MTTKKPKTFKELKGAWSDDLPGLTKKDGVRLCDIALALEYNGMRMNWENFENYMYRAGGSVHYPTLIGLTRDKFEAFQASVRREWAKMKREGKAWSPKLTKKVVKAVEPLYKHE